MWTIAWGIVLGVVLLFVLGLLLFAAGTILLSPVIMVMKYKEWRLTRHRKP